MWGRHAKLVHLYDELETLGIFDRVFDYAENEPNRGDDENYVRRQKRRSEISAEIAKLEVRRPWFLAFRTSAVVLVLFSVTLYAIFHLLK